MECPRCFFDFSANGGEEVCPKCGRSYSYTVNIYLGLLAVVQFILAWSVRYLLTLDVSPLVKPSEELAYWSIWPVSIIERPAAVLVLGGLLALMATGPILTALLFGKRGGWLLAVITIVFGPSVIFGAVLVASAWIAGGQTLRMRNKVASALVALVPVVVYWFVQSRPGVGFPLLRPLQSAVYAPAFFASIFSAAALSALVCIGHLGRFNVRVSGLPAIALMVGAVVAFPVFVGRSETRMAALKRDFGLEKYLIAERPTYRLSAEARQRLREYLGEFPDARQSDEVAYILARDLDAAAREGNGEISADVRDEVMQAWRDVGEEYPESPFAIDAYLALARVYASEGKTVPAKALYVAVVERCKNIKPDSADPLADFSVFNDFWSIGKRLRTGDADRRCLDRYNRARWELALLEENSGCPLCDGKCSRYFPYAMALRGGPGFAEMLERVRKACPKGRLADNVAYELARLEERGEEKQRALAEVVRDYPDTDGALLALYDLAVIESADDALVADALRRLREVQLLLHRRRGENADDRLADILEPLVKNWMLNLQGRLAKPEVPAAQ